MNWPGSFNLFCGGKERKKATGLIQQVLKIHFNVILIGVAFSLYQ